MELDGAGVFQREVEPFDGAVVQGRVRRLPRLGRRDGEAVVLAGDEHAAARALDDGMVRAAVTERQLERLVSGGERQQLVPEADAEQRDPPEQVGDRRY